MKKIISLILVLSLLFSSFSSTAFAYYTEEDCKNDVNCKVYRRGELNLEKGKLLYVPAEDVLNAYGQVVLLENKIENIGELSLGKILLLSSIALVPSIPMLSKASKTDEEIKAIEKEVTDLAKQFRDSDDGEVKFKSLKKFFRLAKKRNELGKKGTLYSMLAVIVPFVTAFFGPAAMFKFDDWRKSLLPQNLDRVKEYMQYAMKTNSHITLSLCKHNEIDTETKYTLYYCGDCREFKTKE